MDIILYSPSNKEKEDILKSKVAKIYVSNIQRTIEKLNCSKEQKLRLLDEIIELKKSELNES